MTPMQGRGSHITSLHCHQFLFFLAGQPGLSLSTTSLCGHLPFRWAPPHAPAAFITHSSLCPAVSPGSSEAEQSWGPQNGLLPSQHIVWSPPHAPSFPTGKVDSHENCYMKNSSFHLCPYFIRGGGQHRALKNPGQPLLIDNNRKFSKPPVFIENGKLTTSDPFF